MKNTAYILVSLTAIFTLIISMDTMRKPYSETTIVFILWAVSPYLISILLIKATKSRAAIIGGVVLSMIVSIFGLVLIIDAMYIHLDAVSGLQYIFVPFWQLVGLFVLMLPVLLLNKVKNV